MKTTRKYPALGILFKEAMVLAIQAGRKTQTRRTIKFIGYPVDDQPSPNDIKSANNYQDNRWMFTDQLNGDGNYAYAKAKYQTGEILYVQEAWRIVHINHRIPNASFYTVQYKDLTVLDYSQVAPIQDYLKARFVLADIGCIGDAYGKWRSSRFMSYGAARIFLKVTDVRVERLNDISKADAIAEGISGMDNGFVSGYKDYTWPGPGGNDHYLNAYNSYATLWESINGKDSWKDNPWVWVYTFERTEKPA